VTDIPVNLKEWYAQVSSVYDYHTQLKLYADGDGDLGFWHRALQKHAYIIGASEGGDPIVQVASGKHAGKILLTDHELYYENFRALTLEDPTAVANFNLLYSDTLAAIGRTSIADLDTDGVIDLLLHSTVDGPIVLADSFGVFYGCVVLSYILDTLSLESLEDFGTNNPTS
jgi:hypothetical protein